MKIALLGTRGIPASYSGFETCVEQLGQRLVDRGHEVTVYCRSHHITYPERYYKGMRLVILPTIPNKYLDTIIHSFLSSLHAILQKYDIALYFIAGNSPVTWIPRVFGTQTILNVDGLDWKREKWQGFAKKYIQLAEYLSTKLPNVFITDSRAVQKYYSERFSKIPLYIPYGSEVNITPPGKWLHKFGLEPQEYALFVGRLVPENNAHHLVQAFKSLDTPYKCVILGDAPYANDYQAYLRSLARGDPRIVFTGYLFGEGYHELGSNALVFVETSGVGGTHPALVESMAFGNCVIVNNTPENLETIGDAGFSYDGESGADGLHPVLEHLIHNPKIIEIYRKKAKVRVVTHYSWERVTDDYEDLFNKLINGSLAVGRRPES